MNESGFEPVNQQVSDKQMNINQESESYYNSFNFIQLRN